MANPANHRPPPSRAIGFRCAPAAVVPLGGQALTPGCAAQGHRFKRKTPAPARTAFQRLAFPIRYLSLRLSLSIPLSNPARSALRSFPRLDARCAAQSPFPTLQGCLGCRCLPPPQRGQSPCGKSAAAGAASRKPARVERLPPLRG